MSHVFKVLLAVFCICVMFAPVYSFAGVNVTGCCNSAGEIATPEEVSTAASDAGEAVSDTVLEVGKAIESSQDKTTEMINKSFELQNEFLSDLFKSYGIAQEKMKSMERSGEGSKSYLATTPDCSSDGTRASVFQGLGAEKDLAANLKEDSRNHSLNTATSQDGYKRLIEQDIEDINSNLLFPAEGTLSVENAAKAKELVKTITDPFPVPALTGDQKNTSSGQQAEVLVKLREARMDVARSVLSDTVAAHSPTLEIEDLVMDIYEKMGQEGDPEIIQEGKVSPMAYINLMTDTRFANEDWLQGPDGINTMVSEIALLRELLDMNAVKMEIDRRQTKSLQQISVMMASKMANDVSNEMDKAINMMRDRAIEEAGVN